ncbi:MAG: cation-transporting P-type ATPase [Gallionella sp.]
MTISNLDTSVTGLSSEQARAKLTEFGYNELSPRRRRNLAHR